MPRQQAMSHQGAAMELGLVAVAAVACYLMSWTVAMPEPVLTAMVPDLAVEDCTGGWSGQKHTNLG